MLLQLKWSMELALYVIFPANLILGKRKILTTVLYQETWQAEVQKIVL